MVNPILSKPKPAPIVEVPVAEEKKDEEMAPAAEELVTPETETMELD